MTIRWNDSTIAFVICVVVFLAVIVAEAIAKPVSMWEDGDDE